MLSSVRSVSRSAEVILQTLSFGLVLISALVLYLLTLGAAAGLLPWLGLAVQIGDRLYENAGQIAQIGGPPDLASATEYMRPSATPAPALRV